MNEIASTPLRSAPASRTAPTKAGPEARNTAPQAQPAGAQGADQVELSEQAQLLSQLRANDIVRDQLVSRVRGEIADGSYLTPDKLNSAADNLLGDLEAYG